MKFLFYFTELAFKELAKPARHLGEVYVEVYEVHPVSCRVLFGL